MNGRAISLTVLLLLSSLANALAPSIPSVLDEPTTPHFAGGTIDCGTNASNISFEVEAYEPEWNAYDTVSVYLDTYCGIWNNTYMVSWGLIDNGNNSLIDSGSNAFETNASSVTYHPNHTDHFNEVDVHFQYMETGNYTVFGLFSVWMNNSWSLLSNVSNTFEVNSTISTTACGFNTSLVDLQSDLPYMFHYEGSTVEGWSDIECPMLNTSYTYTWEMYNQNTSSVTHSGFQNFTATWQNVNTFSDGSGIYYDINFVGQNLTEGVYVLSTTLTSASGGFVDASNLTFYVLPTPVNNTPNGTLNLIGLNNNYSAGSTVQFNLYHTNLDIGATYGEAWYITDASGTTLTGYGWNQNWTANSTNQSTGASLTNLSNGTYCITAALYAIGTNNSMVQLDSNTVCFTIGTVNQSTGCGYDSNYTAIYAYSWQSIFSVGETFESTINTYCDLLGTTTMIEWTVSFNPNNTLVAQQNFTYYATSTQNTHSVNHSSLEIGNYTFVAMLSVWDNVSQSWNYITNYHYNFSYVASNNNVTGGTIDIDTNGYLYSMGDTVEATYESSNLVLGELYSVAWAIYDQNQSVADNGTWDWMAFSTTSVDTLNYTIDGAPLAEGGYCFVGVLYHVNSTTYNATYIAQDDTCIVIGNSTGGGGNNSGNATNDCGTQWNQTYHTTVLSSNNFQAGDTVQFAMNVNCIVQGGNYTLEWFISYDGDNSLQDSGAVSWVGSQTNISTSGSYTIPSTSGLVGTYTLITNLYWVATSSLVDSNSVGFAVLGDNNSNNNSNNNTNQSIGFGLNTNAWNNCVNGVLIVNMTFEDNGNITGGQMVAYADIWDSNGNNISSFNTSVIFDLSNEQGHLNWSVDLSAMGLPNGDYVLHLSTAFTDTYSTAFTLGCTGCGYEPSFHTNSTSLWWMNGDTKGNQSEAGMETNVSQTSVAFIGQELQWTAMIGCTLFDTSYLFNMTMTDENGTVIDWDESVQTTGSVPASGGFAWWNLRVTDMGYINTTNLSPGLYCVEITVYIEPYGAGDLLAMHTECFALMSFDDYDGCGNNMTYMQHEQSITGNPFVQQGLVFTEDSRIWVRNSIDCLVFGESYTMVVNVTNDTGLYKSFTHNFTVTSFGFFGYTSWDTLVSWTEDIPQGSYCSEATVVQTNSDHTQVLASVSIDEECFAVVASSIIDDWWSNQGNDTGSPNNPVMPDVNCSELNNTLGNLSGLNNGWNMTDCENGTGFWFDVTVNGTNVTWYDPIYAVGYDYEVMMGPNVGSIIVPPGYGNDKFDLYLWDGSEFVLVASNLDALTQYWFTDDGGISDTPIENEGVRKFSIRGLELSAKLDPDDDNAFVTGMSFVQDPNEQTSLVMRMTPLTESDEDDDGIADDEDNCVNDANPDQADDNNNGIGDVCDESSPNYNPQTDDNDDSTDGGMAILAILIFVVLGFVAVAFFRKKA